MSKFKVIQNALYICTHVIVDIIIVRTNSNIYTVGSCIARYWIMSFSSLSLALLVFAKSSKMRSCLVQILINELALTSQKTSQTLSRAYTVYLTSLHTVPLNLFNFQVFNFEVPSWVYRHNHVSLECEQFTPSDIKKVTSWTPQKIISPVPPPPTQKVYYWISYWLQEGR